MPGRPRSEAVIEWEKEQDTAKAEKRRPGWAKPKQQKLEAAKPATPRPKKVDMADTEEEE